MLALGDRMLRRRYPKHILMTLVSLRETRRYDALEWFGMMETTPSRCREYLFEDPFLTIPLPILQRNSACVASYEATVAEWYSISV